MSPGKETHNPPCRFMTIPVPGIAPGLPKNPGNSSRKKAYIHPDPWGGPSTCSSCGARCASWRSAAKHSRLGHNRRLQRFFVAGRPTGLGGRAYLEDHLLSCPAADLQHMCLFATCLSSQAIPCLVLRRLLLICCGGGRANNSTTFLLPARLGRKSSHSTTVNI